jgi:hypothetical protein
MNTIRPYFQLSAGWRTVKQASPALAWVGLALLGLSVISLVAAVFDPRLLQGVSVWHKPWKFQVSSALYLFTLALFLSYLPHFDKASVARRYIVWVTLVTAVFEVAYITWQGSMGLPSHYNVSSKAYAMMYTLMGIAAALLTSTSGILGYHIFKSKAALFAAPEAVRLAIGLGLLMTSVSGLVTGMVLGARTRSGGHWVGGTANDAFGLAVLNWSRDGGDLRVAHFFALHAMQIVPLFAVLLLAASPKLHANNAKYAVWLFSSVYGGLCVMTLLQALRGLPFIA